MDYEAELDVRKLLDALNKKRGKNAWRYVKEQTGVSASTFTRITQGYQPSVDGLVRLMVWLEVYDLREFLKEKNG